MPHDGHAHDASDHGHAHVHGPNCAKSTLALAEAQCEERGARLTPLRRRVLEAIAAAGGPIGAYAVMDALADADGHRPAPITVYRALDFLIANALVHRLASLNAYLACNHSHGAGETVVFFICEACERAEEASDAAVTGTIAAAASRAGFRPRHPVLEITGRCAACA